MRRLSSSVLDPATGIPLLAFLCIRIIAQDCESEWASPVLLYHLGLLCTKARTPTTLPILSTQICSGHTCQRVLPRLLEAGCDPNTILPLPENARKCYLFRSSGIIKARNEHAPTSIYALNEILGKSGSGEISLLLISTLLGDVDLVQIALSHGAAVSLVFFSISSHSSSQLLPEIFNISDSAFPFNQADVLP